MIFMVTNRTPEPDKFTNDRNPAGNTWWGTADKPLDQVSQWGHIWDKLAALYEIRNSGKPALLFIHGYNESWTRDMDVMQEVYDALADDFTLVAYSWDSLGNVLAYEQDRGRAVKSAGDLLEVLKDLDVPNVIAHSMGNYVLQEALALVNGSTQAYVNHLAMVAADVDFDVFRKSNIASLTQKILAMYSPADVALEGSGIIHGRARLGAVGPLWATVPNAKAVDCTGLLPAELNPVDLHGAYFKSQKCWELVRGFMTESKGVAA